MSMPSGITAANLVNYGLVLGDATDAQVDNAANLAVNEIEDALGTFLIPKLVEDERHPWPHDGLVNLDKDRLLTTPTVTARHDYGNCDCDVTDETGCSIILDPDSSVVTIRECGLCPGASCGQQSTQRSLFALVSYHAGFTSIPETLMMAVAMLANEKLQAMLGNADYGAGAVSSWRSMDYAEQRAVSAHGDSNPFGLSAVDHEVYKAVKRYQVQHMIMPFSNTRSASLF